MLKEKTNNTLLYFIFFIVFIGSYSAVLLAVSAGFNSRIVTIPIRVLTSLICGVLIVRNITNRNQYLKWFTLFSILYIFRVIYDYANNVFLYIDYLDLVFYFVSFCIMPFLALTKFDFSKVNFEKLYKAFLYSSFIFSSLSVKLYSKYIGSVGRLSSSRVEEEVVSPLTLSYSSTLIIDVIVFYLLFNKTSKKIKVLSVLTIILAIVPFFLGASRGSIFAIFIPFIFYAMSNMSLKSMIKYIFSFSILIALIFYLDNYFQSGLLNRFLGTSEAIETGGSSASRLDIWSKSLSQFVEFPIFGDRLNTVGVDYYPHNIYIEVLQTTGIIGGIPFFVLVYQTIKASFNIFKNHIEYAWIPVIFIQSVMKHMFSGALYNASWFWVSMAIVLSLNHYLNRSKK